MKTFLLRLDERREHILEVVREKAFRDSRATGKDVSRHSLMLEILDAGFEVKKDDPAWKEAMDRGIQIQFDKVKGVRE